MTFDDAVQIAYYPIMYFDERSRKGMHWSAQNKKTMAIQMKRAGYRKVCIRVLPWQKPTVFWAHRDWTEDQVTAVVASSAGQPYWRGSAAPK